MKKISISKILKYLLTYGLITLILVMATKFLQDRAWFLSVFFYLSASLIFSTYVISKKTPGKYLLPGVLLLCLFHIYPAFYSGAVAFTNDSNGHQLSKTQAIDAILQDSKIPVQTELPINYQVVLKDSTREVFLVFKYSDSIYWIGNSKSVVKLDQSQLKFSINGQIESVDGQKVLASDQVERYINQIQNITIKMASEITLQPIDLETLEASQPVFTYNASVDQLTNILSGEKYQPNDNGQMVSDSGELLYPGWKANIGWRNFTSVITDKEMRTPLLAVLTWTIVNAFLIVTFGFLFGLVLALIFNYKHMRSKRFYRTIFIIPLAIPSVLSILVWSGLFTAETGVIDRIFHISTPWLTDPWWARVAVLIVELWSTFPYMFLISTGAIQAIPSEILEAAEIDGASPTKTFTQIKLPLVVRTVAPLLIASGAMALNNFGAIYLLTGGGPTFSNSNGNAGATDILISYTYKLAFNGQEGNNYGLASALSILNFVLVGAISLYGLRKMKTMEEIN